MKIDLDNLNPGVFFLFDEDNEKEGGATIRLANGEILSKIDEKCITKKTKMTRRGSVEEVKENKDLRNEMLWDYVIVDWKGVEDLKGKEIPCTKANKVKLMKGSVKFSSFVGNCIDQLNEDFESYEEDLEKN